MQYKLLAVMFSVILVSGCVSEAYKQGLSAVKNQQYKEAVTLFEKASKEQPDDEKVIKALAGAKQQASDQLYAEALKHAKHDLLGQRKRLDKVLVYSPQHMKATAALADNKQKEQKLHNDVKRVHQMCLAPHEGNVVLEKLHVYNQFFPEITTAQKFIDQCIMTGKVNKGFYFLGYNNLEQARNAFTTAVKLNEGSHPQAESGFLTIKAIEHYDNGTYTEAYFTILKSLSMYNKNPKAIALKEQYKERALDEYFAKIDLLLEKNTFTSLAKSLELIADVQRINPKKATHAVAERTLFDEARRRLANKYVRKADQLWERNYAKYATTILQFLQVANALNDEETREYDGKAAKTLAIQNFKQKLNLSFKMHSQARGDANNFAGDLEHAIVTTLEDSDIKGLNILDRDNVREILAEERLSQLFSSKIASGIDIETAKLVLSGKLVSYNFRQRERTRRTSSTYIDGKMKEDNPAYFDAKEQYEAAQRNYNNRKNSSRNTDFSQQDKAVAIASLIFDVASSTIDSSSVRDAQERLNNTPRYLYKDDVQRYVIDKIIVSVSGQIKFNYTITDSSTSIKTKPRSFSRKSYKEGVSYRGVESTDQNGYKNEESSVIDEYQLQDQLEKEIKQEVTSSLLADIKEMYWKRFCDKAEKKLSRKKFDAAGELFLLCKISSEGQSGTSIKQAKAYIRQYFALTDDVIIIVSEQKEDWPFSAADLNEAELQDVREKLRELSE